MHALALAFIAAINSDALVIERFSPGGVLLVTTNHDHNNATELRDAELHQEKREMEIVSNNRIFLYISSNFL